MGNYIERYHVLGMNFGIEDYQAPGHHFMPDLQKERFKCWVNGGGIGNAKTLMGARRKIRSYSVDQLTTKMARTENELGQMRAALFQLERKPRQNSLIPFLMPDEDSSG